MTNVPNPVVPPPTPDIPIKPAKPVLPPHHHQINPSPAPLTPSDNTSSARPAAVAQSFF